MEFLKEHIGDELYAQLSEKLKGNEKVALVNAKDGGYIPREKWNEANEQVKSLGAQLSERDNQLEALKKAAGQSDALQAQIAQLQLDNKTASEAHNAQMSALRLDYALDGFLRDQRARNPKAVRGLLNMEAIKLDGETLLGAEDQVKALKTSDAYLFEDREAVPGAPNPGAPQPPKGTPLENELGKLFK